MEELEKEKTAVIYLIESWDNNNISLALEILNGHTALKKLVKNHYREMLSNLFAKVDLEDFINFPQKLGEVLKKGKSILKSETLVKVLPKVPIRRLNLSHKNLSEIPWWVFEMTELKELNLRNNNISIIPDEIEKLVNLEVLDLTSNLINEVSSKVGELHNLEKLQLDFNEIELLPDSLSNLSNLRWLCLEANKIEFLPKSLIKLQSLQWLSIERTPLGEKHAIYGGMYVTVNDPKFQKLINYER